MKKILYLILFSAVLSSCDNSSKTRTYTEIKEVSSQANKAHFDKMIAPHSDADADGHSSAMGMANAKGGDPHAGFTPEQLAQMLQETIQSNPVTTSSPLQWSVPKGWLEKPATGLRLASFISDSDPKAIDCSIVTLGAGAGGIEGNIVRWLGQINIPELSAEDLKNFISSEEKISLKNNIKAEVFDFTILQKNQPAQTPSMIASIIDTPGLRVFVKMMGNKDQLQKNKASFKSLVTSLDIR